LSSFLIVEEFKWYLLSLDNYTIVGYNIYMINEKLIKDIIPRIKKIKGQIDGIERMINEKRYCIEILQQIYAIIGGLKAIVLMILKNHIETCVREAMTSRNKKEIDTKVDELIDIYKKFSK